MLKNDYFSYHYQMIAKFGKAPCCIFSFLHKGKRYEWANISGNYEPDIENYIPLCPSCHRKLDYTEEQREKIRIRSKGKNYRPTRKVTQLNLEGLEIANYISVREASRKLGILHTAIANCLSGRAKTAGGFKWI